MHPVQDPRSGKLPPKGRTQSTFGGTILLAQKMLYIFSAYLVKHENKMQQIYALIETLQNTLLLGKVYSVLYPVSDTEVLSDMHLRRTVPFPCRNYSFAAFYL